MTTIRWGHEALECEFDIVAMRTSTATYLTVWRRPGGADTAVLPLPQLSDVDIAAEGLYPAGSASVAVTGSVFGAKSTLAPFYGPNVLFAPKNLPGELRTQPLVRCLELTLPAVPSAVLYRLTTEGVDG